jgi:hypothetical protein
MQFKERPVMPPQAMQVLKVSNRRPQAADQAHQTSSNLSKTITITPITSSAQRMPNQSKERLIILN